MKYLLLMLVACLIACNKHQEPNVERVIVEDIIQDNGLYGHTHIHDIIYCDVNKSKAEVYYQGDTFISNTVYYDTLSINPLMLRMTYFKILF